MGFAMRSLCGASLLLVAEVAGAAAQSAVQSAAYDPPAECVHEATIRTHDCRVLHASVCPMQIVVDEFVDEEFFGRRFYQHPALFTLFIHKSGVQIGHAYGDGAPRWGQAIGAGDEYAYSRSVVRNFDASEPGDEGEERMAVGRAETLRLKGRDITVLPLEFEVLGAAGDYRAEELFYILDAPRIPLGGEMRTYDENGALVREQDSTPSSISFPGEPGFGAATPEAHCLGLSS